MSYEILMQRLGFPNSERLRKILQYLMDEEAAKVASALPGSVEEVAEKLGMDKEKVKRILEDLFSKGVVFPKDFRNREFFRFARDVIQLHDATLASQYMKDPEYAKLWKEFGEKEAHEAVGRILSSVGIKVWRVVPAYNAVKDLPDLLPQENIKEMLKAQKKIAVVPCSCRNVTALAENGCKYTNEEIWHCIQLGRGAEYVIERGSGKEITVEEALKLIDEIEKDGLVHTWANTSKIVDPRVTVNCNCCSDCCEFFLAAKFANVPMESLLEKSRYEAYVIEERCKGCQTCIERCHFDAIELYRPKGSKKFKAKVVAEKCFGCGVCVVGCEEGAIKMKAVRLRSSSHSKQKAFIFFNYLSLMTSDEIERFSKFLSEEDKKILKAVAKDQIAFEILKKIFESPEGAEKYLVLLRDNPNAILIATKIAESVGRYLSSEDEDKCLNIFLKAIEYMKEIKDRKSVYNIFEIVKEAIESRIALGKYESASKLVKIFLNLGMNTYVKKLMFHAIEVSETGDFMRALRILNDLPQNDDVLTTKAYILLEWGKNIASRDPQLGLSKIEEALKLKELQSAKVAMAEIYENIGNYAKSYEIYSSMKDRPGIATKLARLLMEWGEEEKDPKKLEEAKLIVNDPVMLEEIDRRIRKIMDQRASGS